MQADEYAALLQVVAAHAGALRAAGVRSVRIGELSVTLVSRESDGSDLAEDDAKREEDGYPDPFSDPATFARSDGRVPGFPRRARGGDDG